jgi:hypothetical protein
MILISSHRPHSQGGCFPQNQIAAHQSWEGVARRIIYFGSFEQSLSGPTTQFIPSTDFPRIKDMATMAGRQPQITALVNADIILIPLIHKIEFNIQRGFARACISRRHHFEPGAQTLDQARDDPLDRGRDIFVTRPDIWRKVAEEIPPVFRIGHQKWDAWLSDYFKTTQGKYFTDFTRLRCVFHPIHGDRKMPYAPELEDVNMHYPG